MIYKCENYEEKGEILIKNARKSKLRKTYVSKYSLREHPVFAALVWGREATTGNTPAHAGWSKYGYHGNVKLIGPMSYQIVAR